MNGLSNIALAKTAAAQSQSRANVAHAEADSTRVRLAGEVVGRLAIASVATRAENVVVSEVAGELVLELDDLQRSVRGLSNLKRTERGVELTLTDISFDVGKSQLNRQGENAVATLGRALQQYPKRKIRLEGHTDATGSAREQRQLSQRRADAVRDILVEAGLDGEFITTTALGETKPVASNALPDGRKQNRRVEIIIDTPARPVAPQASPIASSRRCTPRATPARSAGVALSAPRWRKAPTEDDGLNRLVESRSIDQTHAKEKAMAAKKPNILILWGDDIGYWNISAYNLGQMGYRTPNIDRIGKEGAVFTDWYGQQSCTAGRACFITGQSGFRTGMLKVGLPGAKEGLQARDVTIAELLKEQGYMTAQFGKNHLGDADETLPTAHGFDEFFGSLYHLNAEEEFENEDYFKDPALVEKYKTRGVIHCWANPDGTQKIESTGPLGKKRMETIDEEVTANTLDYLEKAKKADKPFFLWWNSTRMHIHTHLKKESQGKTGLGLYPDGMVEHDGHVGQILDKLKELGLEDNTIVMYSTDNGAECFSWPDGGTTPFRGEKNENWEGGYRVPAPCAGPA